MYETNDCYNRPAVPPLYPMELNCPNRPHPVRPIMPPGMEPIHYDHPMHMCPMMNPMIRKCVEMCMLQCGRHMNPIPMSEVDYESIYSVDINELNPHIPAE
ncbi:hypothetical protein KQI42_03430 [Tissierella sp. MSJ-40]|uniref:Uncharacterized protein n=1 Tax=Tissierella simiarum TaxID=2841534 RepID=A0ABS6E388_9FIRM|nr:hypothetical protein [Tissierella simiarum]MBU5437046.1 hypothetical protein [Tissierella simiarum]